MMNSDEPIETQGRFRGPLGFGAPLGSTKGLVVPASLNIPPPLSMKLLEPLKIARVRLL